MGHKRECDIVEKVNQGEFENGVGLHIPPSDMNSFLGFPPQNAKSHGDPLSQIRKRVGTRSVKYRIQQKGGLSWHYTRKVNPATFAKRPRITGAAFLAARFNGFFAAVDVNCNENIKNLFKI